MPSHPKENSWQGSNPLFKLSELQTLTTSPAQVCEQHTDVADCTRLSESTPFGKLRTLPFTASSETVQIHLSLKLEA